MLEEDGQENVPTQFISQRIDSHGQLVSVCDGLW